MGRVYKPKEKFEPILALSHKRACGKDVFYEVSVGEENWNKGKNVIKVRMLDEEKKARGRKCPSYGSKKELDKVIEQLLKLRDQLPEE